MTNFCKDCKYVKVPDAILSKMWDYARCTHKSNTSVYTDDVTGKIKTVYEYCTFARRYNCSNGKYFEPKEPSKISSFFSKLFK